MHVSAHAYRLYDVHFAVQFRGNFTDTLSVRPQLVLMFTRKYNKLVVHLKFVRASVYDHEVVHRRRTSESIITN